MPDRVTFRLDRRIVPEENPEVVEAGLRALVGEAARAYPRAQVTVARIMLARFETASNESSANGPGPPARWHSTQLLCMMREMSRA